MTTQMVRKQIYIQKRQEALLKRLALLRNTSEAEIIRHGKFQSPRAPFSFVSGCTTNPQQRQRIGQDLRWN